MRVGAAIVVLMLMALPAAQGQRLQTGAERLMMGDTLPTGRVALVANQTSVVGDRHLLDTLLACGVTVGKVFCPEHGFRGTVEAGIKVQNGVDHRTGVPIVSLYGNNKKPTRSQIADIDCVIFDLQDVGCRFYTYLSTLHYVMEACAESGTRLVVLDRPNPNGHYVDGPVLDTARCSSFVGMHPVPVVYGMTIGEYARMINGEHWLRGGEECELTVVRMEGYRRDSVYSLPVPPSPNLRNGHAIALYPSLCLLEGTQCGVGRGTEWPFEIATYLADTLDLRMEAAPKRFSLGYVMEMHRRVPRGKFFLKNNFFEKLAGTVELRQQIEEGVDEATIRAGWREGIERFMTIREKYLIYKQ